MSNSNIEEKLNAFLKDIEILDGLDHLENEDNLFDILKISQAEIRHSNVLAWLLNPKNSKEVGKYFLRKLFILLMDRAESFNGSDLIVDDYEDVEIRREWKHTDLLIIFKKNGHNNFAICIENKVKSKQGRKQLEGYRQEIETETEFKSIVENNRICYLFLRVKDESPNDKNWVEFDYNDIGNILKEALNHCSMSQELNFFLNQYLSTLRKNGMMDDKQMQELAQKIYNKHKEALDYIYDNAQNEDALKFKHYHNWLNKKSFKKKNNNALSCISFATDELHSKVFEGLSTETNGLDLLPYCYYEIQKRFMNEIKLVLHKEDSLPEVVQERLDKVRSQLIKKTNSDWVWTSACKEKIGITSFFEKKDINDDDIDSELTKLLDAALEKCEKSILDKIGR